MIRDSTQVRRHRRKGPGWVCALIAVAALLSSMRGMANEKSAELGDTGRGEGERKTTAAWPVFRGDTAGSGVAASTLPKDLQLLWTFQAEDSFFAATAAIVDGVVFVGDADKHFYTIDLNSGRKLWSYEVEIGFLASPAVRGGRVFIGDSDGVFYCLSAQTGKLIWKHETGAEINSSANFYKESVLVGSQDGTLYRFLTKDGSIVWKYTIEASGGIQCSPTLGENRAFVGGCDGKLHVIDVDKGTTIAALDIGDPTLSTPAVRGDHVYLGTEGANLFGIDWRNPKILWTYTNPQRRTSYRSSPAVTEHVVVIGGRNKLIEAIDRKTGKQSWSFATKGRVDSSPVIVGDRIFFGSSDGRLYELALATGTANWSYDAGSGFDASPAVAEGCLVIGNEDGVLYCFGQKPGSGER